jgi:hypothetical protein
MRQSTKVLQSLTFLNSDLVLGDLTVNFDVKHLIKPIRDRYICVISVDKIEKGTELFTKVDIEKIGEYYFVGTALQLNKVEHEKDCVYWNGVHSNQIKINGSLACQIKHEFSISNNSNFFCKINVNDVNHIKTKFSNLIDECVDLSIPKLDIKIEIFLLKYFISKYLILDDLKIIKKSEYF